MRIVEATGSLLVFERGAPGQTLLCAFNLSHEPAEWRPAQPDRWRTIEQVGAVEGWRFGPYAGMVAERIG